MRSIHLLSCLLVCFGSSRALAEEVPRRVIALWDSSVEGSWRGTVLHQIAEMPLNHLGLILEPHDINKPLPDLANRPDVRGVITWFQTSRMSAPTEYLRWATRAVDSGKRYVALGDWGFLMNSRGDNTPLEEVNAFLVRLGLEVEGRWHAFPFDIQPLVADSLIGFEAPLGPALPPFTEIRRVSNAVINHLSVGDARHGILADLVVTGPAGGYSAGGYNYYNDDAPHRHWIIDPFEFFRQALGTEDLPNPDTTTLNGRRIYYSQIDGDGWRNESLASERRDESAGSQGAERSIEVLIREAIRPFPDLPVTVAPVAADLDPRWCGDARAQRTAREVFALPQVEAGSHTYSHPLDWQFFADYRPERERPYRRYALACHPDHLDALWHAVLPGSRVELQTDAHASVDEGAAARRPRRSFADHEFALDQEITGAARYIEQFAPAGKRVAVIQWSGNALPFGAALRQARSAGLPALNGGDTRFDPEFPSLAWVAPVGRWDDGEVQIYASSSNENTYTYDWTGRYYGYKYLPRTLQGTESPRRLKPIDVYYHAFSGDRRSSVEALKATLRWSAAQRIIPIRTSAYVHVAEGFYSTRLLALGARAWRIQQRGALQTIRFDDAAREDLDWQRSAGVLGSRRVNGSLYVALDPDVSEPVVALSSNPQTRPVAALIDSRWLVRSVHVNAQALAVTFTTSGFGPGEMIWSVPRACGRWRWSLTPQDGPMRSGIIRAGPAGELAVSFGRLDGQDAAAALECADGA